MPRPALTRSEEWLRGSKSKAATPPSAPSNVVAGRPRIPKDLSPDARKVFKRLCVLLESRRALTEGDTELLRLYAVVFDRHKRAMAHVAAENEITTYTRLDNHGVAHDIEKKNLWLDVATTAERTMVGILDRLGLTPANREKIKPAAPAPAPATPIPGTALALCPELFKD